MELLQATTGIARPRIVLPEDEDRRIVEAPHRATRHGLAEVIEPNATPQPESCAAAVYQTRRGTGLAWRRAGGRP